MWLVKHSRHWTLNQPTVLHMVCSRGIGFQPVTVFMTSVRICSSLQSFFCSSRTGWKPIPRARHQTQHSGGLG
jgi:hypothetical protein